MILALTLHPLLTRLSHPRQPAGNNKPCDTGNADYTTVIEPIFRGSCYTCHSTLDNTGGYNFEDTASLKRFLENDFMGNGIYGSLLLHAILRTPGSRPMPPGGALDSCSVNKIKHWINIGAPL